MYYVFEQSLYIQPNLGQYRQANGWDQCYPGEQPCGEYASSPANLSMHSTGMWALQWPSQGMILSLLSVQAQVPSKNQQVCTKSHQTWFHIWFIMFSPIHHTWFFICASDSKTSFVSLFSTKLSETLIDIQSDFHYKSTWVATICCGISCSSSFKFSDAPSANSLRELQEFV